jgi:hypothetical protein
MPDAGTEASMSWWRTKHEDDLVGDEVADRVTEALDSMLTARQEQGFPKPTLQDLVDAIAAALGRARPGSAASAVATLAGGEQVLGHSDATMGAQDLVTALAEAFADSAPFYRAYLDRDPKPSELAACVAFVLAGEPEAYLSDGSQRAIESITADVTPGI